MLELLWDFLTRLFEDAYARPLEGATLFLAVLAAAVTAILWWSGRLGRLLRRTKTIELEPTKPVSDTAHPEVVNALVAQIEALKAELRARNAEITAAVSYTHLTLPTICSV